MVMSIASVEDHCLVMCYAYVLCPACRYIYNQKRCGRCGSGVRAWDMATRTAYACETCQPLLAGTLLSPARAADLASGDAPKLFNSHCAPDDAGAQAAGGGIALGAEGQSS